MASRHPLKKIGATLVASMLIYACTPSTNDAEEDEGEHASGGAAASEGDGGDGYGSCVPLNRRTEDADLAECPREEGGAGGFGGGIVVR